MKPWTIGDWTGVGSLLVSTIALVFAGLSLCVARGAQRLAQRQEARRTPRLQLRLLSADYTVGPNCDRLYVFGIEAANPTDTANTISTFELMVRYHRDLPMTLRLPAKADFQNGKPTLCAPLRIEAHGAAVGQVAFLAPRTLLESVRIDGYEVIALDAHRTPAGVDVLHVWDRTE